MRVLIAEDSALVREGLASLLVDAGYEIAGGVANAVDLVRAVEKQRPDIVIADVRMPPTMTDDGARAAAQLRQRYPELPILLLSQHIETVHSVALAATGRFGYLLKDRVLEVDDFLESVARVAAGGSVLDPEVVASLVQPRRLGDPLARLSAREGDVLALMAEGRSNTAIASELWLTPRTVESHVRSILSKLELGEDNDSHRRVMAVLTYLATGARPATIGHTPGPTT